MQTKKLFQAKPEDYSGLKSWSIGLRKTKEADLSKQISISTQSAITSGIGTAASYLMASVALTDSMLFASKFNDRALLVGTAGVFLFTGKYFYKEAKHSILLRRESKKNLEMLRKTSLSQVR